MVTSNITFINEGLIPKREIDESLEMLKDIDIKGAPFVALTKYLNGTLWTGDKVLINGLKANKFLKTITTSDLFHRLDDLERE